eukprot:5034315-Amphidinium_carterae.1
MCTDAPRCAMSQLSGGCTSKRMGHKGHIIAAPSRSNTAHIRANAIYNFLRLAVMAAYANTGSKHH